MIDRLGRHASLRVPIECLGAIHHLRWEAGELHTVDHDDPEGERALAALGAARCACIDAVDTWVRHADDLEVLVLASRGPTDPLTGDNSRRGPGGATAFPASAGGGRRLGVVNRGISTSASVSSRSGSYRLAAGSTGAGGSAGPAGDNDDLAELLGLDPALARRLAVTVAAGWADRLAAGDPQVAGAGPALAAALYGRATSAVRQWLGSAAVAPTPKVVVDLIPAGEPPRVSRTEAGVHLDLPFDWLVEVWGRDVTIVWDRLTLGVSPSSDPGELRLLTVGRDFDALRPLTLRLGAAPGPGQE